MNIEKVFEFIKERRGYDYPFKYKLKNGYELTEDDLNVKGDLIILSDEDITSLPNNLNIERDLIIQEIDFKILPDDLTIGRDLIIYTPSTLTFTSKYCPYNLRIGADLDIRDASFLPDEDEIKYLIENRGGYINGYIFINELY